MSVRVNLCTGGYKAGKKRHESSQEVPRIHKKIMKVNSRRNILGLAAAFLLKPFAKAQNQPPARGTVKELARHALTGPDAGREAVLVEVTVPQGVPSTTHRHPGFVLGYVLEGEMRFAIDGTRPEAVKTGSAFFEPHGALHTAGESAKPDAPVRFLAFMVVPKGSPVALPA
jgi:quercetin dioxygenase-like cupin family protein